jgi:glucosamine--fructose-6-phosphate aminotransferase (isomerizing)
MCGIIGYIGTGSALPIIIKGLERLEYRGYDSAGIIFLDKKSNIKIEKCKGRVKELKKLIEEYPIKCHIGLGHTRWATHGIPSTKNAHPHCDCTGKLAIVHNGIIENFGKLKSDLQKKKHKFVSDTDSEVIAHLIEDELKGTSSFESACRNAFKKLEGSFAIGIINSDYPNQIIGVRQNSPLVVGLGNKENFIASDVTAIIDHTKKVIYINNLEVVILNHNKIKITDIDGNNIDYSISEVDWDIDKVEKGGYEKFMMKEMHEQPEVIRQLIKSRIKKDNTGVEFAHCGLDPKNLNKLQKLAIVACGTAYHAGIVGRYLIEHFTDIPVEIDIASEFRYRKPKLSDDTFVISVTQSGETADTIACIREAKRKGCYLLSICNVVGSTISRESDAVIYTHAGPEIGVASTKAYTTQLVAFSLLTIYLAQLKGQMKPELTKRIIAELETIPDKIQSILEKKETIKKIAYKYAKAKSTLYIGRGFNYPTALEGALKNKEISYIHAEGYPAGEMKHGPIALIDKDLPVICICTKGDFYEKMISNIKEVEARKGKIIIIATEGDEEIKKIADDVIYVPETWDEFSPIINVVPLQLFAYYTALARGCDIDKPRNLAKSVTVE